MNTNIGNCNDTMLFFLYKANVDTLESVILDSASETLRKDLKVNSRGMILFQISLGFGLNILNANAALEDSGEFTRISKRVLG